MSLQYTAGKPTASQFCVPAGEYSLTVVEAKEDTSKKGNDQIKMVLKVIREDGSDGPKLFDYLVFSENCFWKVDAFLKSCGEHPGEGVQMIFQPMSKMIGWQCRAKLKVETYNGKENNKVDAYLFDGDENNKMDDCHF